MHEVFNITIIAIVQSLYDFAGWFGIIQRWLRAEEISVPARIYRVIKETLDYPVTLYLLIFVFHTGWAYVAAFYIAKWFHLCDGLYNVYEFILTNKPAVDWGHWRWWTPLGLLRSNWWGFCPLKGHTQYDYNESKGYWQPTDDELISINPVQYDAEAVNHNNYSYYKTIGFSRGMVNIHESWMQTAAGLVSAAVLLFIWA
jgi:hypothetical protein